MGTPAVRHVVLLGLMGAGKTAVGAGLAARLGWGPRDSDADIRAATGRTARQLDEERGPAELHRLEAGHLIDAIATPGPSVIGAAASTIDDPAARSALADERLLVVWLRADPATLAARMGRAGHRRGLGPDLVAGLTGQASSRYPRFAALEPLIIDVDDRPPAQIVTTIAARLEAGAR